MAQDLRVSSWVLEGSGQWLDDRGLTHGLGVFETMLVVRGEIFNGGSHRRRMIEGCRRLQITEADWSLVESAIGNRAGGFDSDFLRARVMRSAGKGGFPACRAMMPRPCCL
jgi:4-amino-4-deoxychorismate lyase